MASVHGVRTINVHTKPPWPSCMQSGHPHELNIEKMVVENPHHVFVASLNPN